MHVLVKLGMTFVLMLLFSCGKGDDQEVVIPDIALNKSELTLEKGKTERLIASFTPAEAPDKGHVWSSSNPSVAMVDETGMVTAVETGEAVVTTTALTGKKKATCKVTVVDKVVSVTGVSVEPSETTMVVGDDLILEAIVAPENATNKAVAWSSDDSKIASVDAAGKVTALAEGKVNIRATTRDGDKTGTCQIIVVIKGVEISKPEVSGITSISALVRGTVKAMGVKTTEVGICYSVSKNPTVRDEKVVLSSDNLSYTMTKLEANTTYYVRIYAVVDGITKYGDQAMFTTATAVDISIPQVSSISSSSAYIEGTITTHGLQTEEVGICYATSATPTVDNIKIVLSNNSIGYTLNGLTSETVYYVRIFAKINGKYYYGEQGMFETIGVVKTHFEATDIYEDKVVLTSASPSGMTTVNICYGTSPNPKISDNVTTANVGDDGKLKLTLTGLKEGTVYYLRSYSILEGNVDYNHDEISFQTLGVDFIVNRITAWVNKDYYYNSTISYDINVSGTYLVEIDGDSGASVKNNADYVKTIYIENGKGEINYRGTIVYWGGYDAKIKEAYLVFTNIKSNVSYYFKISMTNK